MRAGKTPNKLPLKERLKEAFWVTLFIILLPVIIVYLLLWGIWHSLCGLWLRFAVRIKWLPEGKNMLFVYSDSPNWKEYIESNILPRISDKAVVANWSERSKWDWTNKPLELRIFRHWTGVYRYIHGRGKKEKWYGRDFNPVAITFAPWWRVRVFRFWKAFKDHKHGKDKKLRELEHQLYRTLKLEK